MTSRTTKVGYTAAAALGLFIGAAGIAAASTGGTTEPAPANQTDEADDGVDHQFEGEEVGENGDGIPDVDDATEDVTTVNGLAPDQQDNATTEPRAPMTTA